MNGRGGRREGKVEKCGRCVALYRSSSDLGRCLTELCSVEKYYTP